MAGAEAVLATGGAGASGLAGAGAAGEAPSAGDFQEQRPFELVRYFSVISLIIILLFSLLISSLISRRAGELVLKKREQYALLLAENLNHQVITRFVVPTLREHGGINVGQPEQFKLLDAVVKNSIQSFQVERVNILDLEGNIIYSTQPEYIGRVGSEWRAFSTAAAGGYASLLDPPREFFELGGGPRRFLKTYIPLRDERRRTAELGPPRAVFEITLDITGDFREVWLDQVLILGALMAMMALLFIILRAIVIRGQRIMDRRAAREARLKEQLHQSERLASLGRMIAGVAHEIRNPLGIVRSTAELLGSRVEPANKPLAEVIVEESTRLARVVTEFLDFARPQKPELRPLVVEEVLRRNLQFLQPEAERLGVQVREDFASPPLRVRGDADLLYRGFLNVFNNALQAMEETGGSLRVATRRLRQQGRDWVVITVDDSGPGFSLESGQRLFDPFFTTKETGTGLGLSILNNIVASHQGRIQLGQAPGGGARVEIWLPGLGD